MAFRLPPPLVAAALLLWACSAMAAQRCPDCGSAPVPYPLSTAPGCGDQSYKVRCLGSTLWFDTVNSTYSIKSIDPQARRLVIRPANFTGGGDTCVTTDLPSRGVQLNASLPFNISSENTLLYLNCSERLLLSPLNCTSASLCHAYINATREAAACARAPICCTFKTGGSSTAHSITVQQTGCKAYRSIVSLNPSRPIGQWGEQGVQIQWVPPQEPLCRSQTDCDEGASSTCRVDAAAVAGIRISRCYCNSGLHWDSIKGVCAEDLKDSTNRAPLIAGLTSGVGVVLVVSILSLLIYRRHRRIRAARDRLAREREAILNAGGVKCAKIFTGKQIKRATGNFARDRLLGVGGYGEVYKGILEDGTAVAFKCAKLGNAKGTDQVLNEVRILCQLNHRSLVRLLGCCVELERPLLVYEFIPNGTLLEHLQGGRSCLPWAHRLRIARDAAEGLAYLHTSAVPPIYHRDVKSSNILLDGKLNARLSDFGLSRLAETDLSHVSTCAQGTLGYLDPEYYRNYQLTEKSDVYSFGVVLLELLTAQKAIDFGRGPEDVNLAIYARRIVEEERLMEAVDPAVAEGAGELEVDTMKAVGFLAVSCLEERRQDRPSMKEVTEEIEYIISILTAPMVEPSK